MPARQAGAERSEGIAPEIQILQIALPHDTCVRNVCQWLHCVCTDVTL